MSPDEIAKLRSFLPTIPIFGGLEGASLDRIISVLKVDRVSAGTRVCREGEAGRSMHIVLEGEVVVCRPNSVGGLVKMVRMGPGEFFGEMTLIDPQPRASTVVVEKPSTLLSLTNRDLVSLYKDDVQAYVMVLQNICRELSRRLRKADARITELAEEQPDEMERTQIVSKWSKPKS